ncbi:hypothetical protein [Cognatishimia sp. MH4019]|uniref:hypothetical protein n=1 Tax=Cognatishimia sp. MH4019 TaxID=2854030 RepID=UPI001CD21254|nr:hypothetical protein [Cognatishimia sp. MH4019]
MATNAERNTEMRQGDVFAYDLDAAAKINKGALVVLDAGYAKAGFADNAVVTVGVAMDSADAAEGDLTVKARTGTFKFRGATGADEITRTEIGKDCFVLDDETVAKTDGGGARSKAGRVRAVEGASVWITI